MENPMQPINRDGDGKLRFKGNKIVEALLDWATPRGFDLNTIGTMDFSQDDRTQFAQLIGYSVWGFHELSYVPDTAAEAATWLARETVPGVAEDEICGCRDQGCPLHCGVDEE